MIYAILGLITATVGMGLIVWSIFIQDADQSWKVLVLGMLLFLFSDNYSLFEDLEEIKQQCTVQEAVNE